MITSVQHAREAGCEQCQRCRQYYRECAYDLARGCRPDCVLCNRCIEVLKTAFPEFWQQQVWPGRKIMTEGEHEPH